MSEFLQIGEVSILANIPLQVESSMGQSELQDLAAEITKTLQEKLTEAGLSQDILIVNTRWAGGCIVDIMTLALSTAAVTGIYKGVKDYKAIRESLIQLYRDMGTVVLKLKRHFKNQDKSTLEDTPNLSVPSQGIWKVVYCSPDESRISHEYVSVKLAAYWENISQRLPVSSAEDASSVTIRPVIGTSGSS